MSKLPLHHIQAPDLKETAQLHMNVINLSEIIPACTPSTLPAQVRKLQTQPD